MTVNTPLMKVFKMDCQTAQLCLLNEQNLPISFASGCLVRICGKKLILSVAHATGKEGKWAVQIEYDKKLGAKNFIFGAMNFLEQICLSTLSTETVDFSYVSIPEDVCPALHIVDPRGDTISKTEITVFDNSRITTPRPDGNYSFQGGVKQVTYGNIFDPSRPIFDSENIKFENLKFSKRVGNCLHFILPWDHPGHNWFHGCSGAPVTDEDGLLVGLVTGGCIENNQIHCVALDVLIPVIKATMDLES